MIRLLFVALFGFFISLNGFSQNKLFTVKDVEIGYRRDFAPLSMPNLQWRGLSTNFTFQDALNLYQLSVDTRDTLRLMDLGQLNAILGKEIAEPLTYIPYITWENEKEFHFFASNNWYCVDADKKALVAVIRFPENADHHAVFYPRKLIAYTVDNNVYVTGTDNKPVRVTNDASKEIVNGESVSRNEFGINEGLFWSPQGNFLAFYRKDNSKVGNYPLVDVTAREAELNNIKYPMAGMASEHVSVGVFDIASQKTVFIERQDTVSEKYLTNVSWSPDEKNIYIQVLNRAQNHMMLTKYLAGNGSLVKTLFEERHNKYVEPLHKLVFLNKNKNWFIYQSRRDGYNHAYIYNTDGAPVKQLTSGAWEITSIESVDSQDNVYYMSTEGSPLEEHGFRINAVTSKKTPLTTVAGTHQLVLNKTYKYWIDDYSNTTTPHTINLMSDKGKVMRTLLNSPNRLSAYKMPEMKIGTIKSADGKTDLYYRLIKPVDFDSTKKYPAIIYVYGGPHAQMINNRWLGGARLWDYMMAQKGYVMLTVDNRGSANRGLEFENVIHRQCGVAEMQDQLEGVKLLKNLGYVDMSRVGVHGWSFGGFMTISLMTTYPEIFKTGVAGGPVIDWKYYEVMYGERYMDTPQENPEGYAATSLIAKAKNLKGKLLIIHGAIDPTVVWQNSLMFIEECIKNQRQVDYFVYPRHEHNVYGIDRVHLMTKITSYFDDNL
jgi:dipeptidyl-peptidase-4